MKLLLLVLVIALVGTAQSLKCYQCTNCTGEEEATVCKSLPPDTSTTKEPTTTEDTTTAEQTSTTETPEPEQQLKALSILKNHSNIISPKQIASNEILGKYHSVDILQTDDASEASLYCYEAHYTENNKHQIARGCVHTVAANNKCPDTIADSLPGEMSDCWLCQNDNCNNGSAITKLSFFALFIVLLSKIIA